MPEDFFYYRQQYAYFLLVTPLLLGLFWFLYKQREKAIQNFSAYPNLSKVLIQRSYFYFSLTVLSLVVAWSGAIFSWMDPQGNGRYLDQQEEEKSKKNILEESIKKGEGEEQIVKKQRKLHDIIFLLDASASMSVKDTRMGVSRLEFAKEIIEEVVKELRGPTAALYAFTSEVFTVSPATVDYLFLRLMLKNIGINEGDVAGTDLMEALGGLKNRYFSGPKEKLKTLILLTDGGDTRLETLENKEREKEIKAILSRLGNPKEQNLRVYCVGMGSKKGEVIPGVTFNNQPVYSSLDEELLESLSKEGRGHYYFANEFSALSIAEDILLSLKQDSPYLEEVESKEKIGELERLVEEKKDTAFVYDLYFQIPLAFAIFALSMTFLYPEVRKK